MFIIDAITYSNLTTYKIKYQDNEPIKGAFYELEIQLIVEPKTYDIKTVIPKKRRAIVYCYM